MSGTTRLPVSQAGRQGLVALRAALVGRPADETLSVADRRAGLAAYAASAGAAAPVTAVTLAGVAVERHDRPGHDHVTIIYGHGGAYVIGSASTHLALAAAVADAAGLIRLAVDYRLAPEHPFPAGRDDLVAVCEALAGQGTRFALVGDSAGGGLVLQAALALAARDRARPAAIAVISPWVDLACRGASYTARADVEIMLTRTGLVQDAARYLNGRAAEDVQASVLHADLRALPPLLTQIGEDELLLDDALALAERARAAGVDVTLERWEAMVHSWHVFGRVLPEAAAATQQLDRFLCDALPQPSPTFEELR